MMSLWGFERSQNVSLCTDLALGVSAVSGRTAKGLGYEEGGSKVSKGSHPKIY